MRSAVNSQLGGLAERSYAPQIVSESLLVSQLKGPLAPPQPQRAWTRVGPQYKNKIQCVTQLSSSDLPPFAAPPEMSDAAFVSAYNRESPDNLLNVIMRSPHRHGGLYSPPSVCAVELPSPNENKAQQLINWEPVQSVYMMQNVEGGLGAKSS